MINLIVGDALEKIKNLKNESIDLVILDPPYLTTSQSWDKVEVVKDDLAAELNRVMKDSASLYVWCGIGEKSQSLIRWFPIFSNKFIFKDLITWKKRRGIGMRKGWLYTREEIMWFAKSSQFIWNTHEQYSDEINQFKKGMSGTPVKEFKRITNVWTDIPEELVHRDRAHYTPKPYKATERIIKLHTDPGMTVLDPFAGSGITAVVCKDLNRDCIAIDINSDYIEHIKDKLK